MRVGIDSGEVLMGSIGNDLQMDYTAIGNPTNFASRMESLAAPGSILVSGDTHGLAQAYFRFESLGQLVVKGKAKPQEAYELMGASDIETRFEASIARGLTKFI